MVFITHQIAPHILGEYVFPRHPKVFEVGFGGPNILSGGGPGCLGFVIFFQAPP